MNRFSVFVCGWLSAFAVVAAFRGDAFGALMNCALVALLYLTDQLRRERAAAR